MRCTNEYCVSSPVTVNVELKVSSNATRAFYGMPTIAADANSNYFDESN